MLSLSNAATARTNKRVSKTVRDYLLDYGFYFVILCLMAFFTIKSGSFLTIRNFMNISTQAGYLIVVSFGVMLTILTGGIDLSVGSVLAFSCIVGCTVMQKTQSITLGIAVILLTSTFCGTINGITVAVLKLPAFIATMAMMNVTGGLALFLTNGASVSGLPDSYSKIGWSKIFQIPVTLILALAIFLIMWFLLKRTAYGRRLYAVGGNPKAANIMGIHVTLTVIIAYVISGLMAGIGGVMLSARLATARCAMAETLQMDTITAVVVGGTSMTGGRGSIVGTLIGACLISMIRNGLNLIELNYYYQLVITGAIIILAVAIDCMKHIRDK